MASQKAGKPRPKKESERAFYEKPEESSASIIADARRDAIRPIQTRRPYTPAQRNLFARRSSGKARPPSAVSIVSELLPEEPGALTRRSLLPPLERRASLPTIERPLSQQLELSQVASAVTPQNSVADFRTLASGPAQEATEEPHFPDNGTIPPPPTGPRPASTARRHARPTAKRKQQATPTEAIAGNERPRAEPTPGPPPQTSAREATGTNNSATTAAQPEQQAKAEVATSRAPKQDTAGVEIDRAPDESTSAAGTGKKRASKSASGSYAQERTTEDTEPEAAAAAAAAEESGLWLAAKIIIRQIDAARQRRNVNKDSICVLCNAVYVKVKEINASESVPQEETLKNRKKVLSIGFRLLPLKHPQTSICVAKIAFELHVSGANLKNLVKTIFSVAQTPGNDVFFADEELLSHLTRTMLASQSDGVVLEASVYAGGVLKLASNHRRVAELLATEDVITRIAGFLRSAAQLLTHSASGAQLTDRNVMDMGSQLVQITGILRNLAEHSQIHSLFMTQHISKLLFPFLSCMPREKELIFNIIRVYSYLTQDAPFQETLALENGCAAQLLELIKRCLAAPDVERDLLIRLWFIIGNLEEDDDDFRAAVVPNSGAVEELVALVSKTVDIVGIAPLEASGDLSEESVDILGKAVRVLANLCPSASVGPMLVSSKSLFQVVVLMFEHKQLCSSLPLMKVVMALLGNLSYHVVHTSILLQNQTQVMTFIMPFITSDNVAIGRVASHVLSNLTRSKDGRDYVEEHNLLDRLVCLVAAVSDADMVYYLLGSLVNLSNEVKHRKYFRSTKTVTWLINAVKYYGPADWEIASLSCQVLWNCCNETDDNGEYKTLEIKTATNVAEVLTAYIETCPHQDDVADSENSDEKARLEEMWQNYFVPVARMLLSLVSSHISCWEPLTEPGSGKAMSNTGTVSNPE